MHFGLLLHQNEHRLPFIFWSDEVNLHLNGNISRHHCRIWSRNKPRQFLTKPLHHVKVTVCFCFTLQFSVTPFFFDETINAESYLHMLTSHLKPQLTQKRKLSSTTFMQDGGPPHFASTIIQFLIRTFTQGRSISHGCNLVWLSRSSVLNLLDYWFWGLLNLVFSTQIYQQQFKLSSHTHHRRVWTLYS